MFTHEEDAGVHRHIQRRDSGPGVQPDERARITRGELQPQCLPVHRSQSAYTQHMQLPKIHSRTVRSTENPARAQNLDAQSRGTRGNDVRLCHVEPARVPLRHAASSLPQLPDSLHRLAKEQIAPTTQFPFWTRLSRREMRASRRLYAGGRSCSQGLWRAWRIRDCRSA